MQSRHRTGSRVAAAAAVAAVGVLAAGPTASAKVKSPTEPKAKPGKRVAKATPRGQRSGAREIVSLGYDSRSGLELYVVKVDGQVIGDPFG